MKRLITALALCPSLVFAGDITVSDAMVPLAPKGVMAHAGFMDITNTGDDALHLVGVTAPDYGMTHIHKTVEVAGVATMSPVDMVEIAPGQTVEFAHGGLHIMLMHPKKAMAAGDSVAMTLQFSDGSSQEVVAHVMKMQMHGHKHGHDHHDHSHGS